MKTILLIEDNEVIRKNTAEILEMTDYAVDTAKNGRIGVEKAPLNKPNLVICDIMIPVVSGQYIKLLAGRVAYTLLRLHGQQPDGLIQLSRDDLANLIGTATELLIRTLTKFKQDSLIEMTASGVCGSYSPINCAGPTGERFS